MMSLTASLFSSMQAPHEDYFSVHIRRVGDWTESLAKACHVDEGEYQEIWKMPRYKVYTEVYVGIV